MKFILNTTLDLNVTLDIYGLKYSNILEFIPADFYFFIGTMYDYPSSIIFNPPHIIEPLKPALHLFYSYTFDILSVIGRRPFVYSNTLVHSLHDYMPLCLALLVMMFTLIMNFIFLFMEYLINLILRLIKYLQLNGSLNFTLTIFILFSFFSTVTAFNPDISL